MSNYILLSEKKWHDGLFEDIKRTVPGNWTRISSRELFTVEALTALQPDLIFIPHWSYIIPAAVYEQFNCIVFHMTDLPYGRGGSPLQNLIVRGHMETKISALKVTKGIDTGDIYLKKPLSLEGTAEEIFVRAASIIGQMIKEIINDKITPVPQSGEVVEFARRKPSDGDILNLDSVESVYDHIRMLDCEGYPNAFAEAGNFRFEFFNATLQNDKTITAHVRIIKK